MLAPLIIVVVNVFGSNTEFNNMKFLCLQNQEVYIRHVNKLKSNRRRVASNVYVSFNLFRKNKT